MTGELFGPNIRQCKVVCADGVELLGLATIDPQGNNPGKPIIVYVHGQFDNAYQQPVNRLLADSAYLRGMPVILTNNRGQDYYSYQRVLSSSGGQDTYGWELYGSSFERVADGTTDIATWLEFAAHIKAQKSGIVLIGHSHGAVKAANYLSQLSDVEALPLKGVVLLSPSDDIGGQRKRLGDRYDDALTTAATLVEAGNGRQYMPEWTYSSPISAQTYLEAFGNDSPLCTFALHDPAISPLFEAKKPWSIPTLIVYGENDAATAGIHPEDALAVIRRDLLANVPSCSTQVIANADHHYRGHEATLITEILDWIEANCDVI